MTIINFQRTKQFKSICLKQLKISLKKYLKKQEKLLIKNMDIFIQDIQKNYCQKILLNDLLTEKNLFRKDINIQNFQMKTYNQFLMI